MGNQKSNFGEGELVEDTNIDIEKNYYKLFFELSYLV